MSVERKLHNKVAKKKLKHDKLRYESTLSEHEVNLQTIIEAECIIY